MAEGTCQREGCERPIRCRGLCKSHYTIMRRNAPDRPRCDIEGCDRPRYAKALCQSHYAQLPESRDSHRTATREYARRNADRMAADYRLWLAANPEKRRAARRRWMAKWRAANPEAARAAFLKWTEANPQRWTELQRASAAARRARKAATQIELIDFALVLAEHGMTCHICGDDIASMTDLHFDHVIPLAKGGTHTYDNLKPAHARCNLRKHAKLLA